MTTLRQRLDQAEATAKIKRPAPDNPMEAEIRLAARAFAAGLPCPADVSPGIWQIVLDLEAEY